MSPVRAAAPLVASLLLVAACTPKKVDTRIAVLEARVAALEAQLARTGPQRPGVAPAIPDPRTAEAEVAIRDLRALIDGGDPRAAAKKCAETKERYGDLPAWRAAQRSCDELAIVGTRAMPFEVTTWYQGGPPDPSQPMLLVFFEEWCPHCRREVPKLQELSQDRAGQLAVVGLTKVNRSATDEKVRAFLAEFGVTYPVARETGSMTAHYGVSGVPAAALVKDGEVVWRGHPARLNDAMLDELL